MIIETIPGISVATFRAIMSAIGETPAFIRRFIIEPIVLIWVSLNRRISRARSERNYKRSIEYISRQLKKDDLIKSTGTEIEISEFLKAVLSEGGDVSIKIHRDGMFFDVL